MLNPFRWLVKLLSFFFYSFLALVVFLGFFLINLPNISALSTKNPTTTQFMKNYMDRVEDKGEEPVIDQRWVNYSKISSNLKKAVLISEDDAFFEHHGFDWKQIQESIKKNWKNKAFSRGGSTITQQLVKNLYLGPQKNIFRKIRESIIAYQMENTLTKTRIFELYLNLIEWGPGVYGADAASRYYFGKSASSLSAGESAFLAAIIPNPIVYGVHRNSKKVSWKTNLILRRMRLPPIIQEGVKKEAPSEFEIKPTLQEDLPEPEEDFPEPLVDY